MLKLKKTLAVFLAILMVSAGALSSVITASAKDFSDVAPDDAFSAQIDMLSDIGVIKGTTDTEFSPNALVTREQMALLLYRLMTGKDNSGRVNTSPFNDLYEPAYSGAISWAHACGYILGTSTNTFNPTGGITLQDAIAMVTRALGQTNDKTNAGYPWSYIDIGTRLGLTEGLQNVSYEKTLTRAQTAALLYNAITADYIITKNVSGTNIPMVTNVLKYVYGYESGTAFITATNNFALPGTTTVIRNGYAEIDVVNDEGNIEAAYVKVSDLGITGDVNEYLGESFRVFYSINNRTGIASVLGAAPESFTQDVNSFTVGSGNSFIQIGGVKYNVVESYSDSTSTNANELLVFVYDEDETLSQVNTNAALAEKNGFFSLKLIYTGGSELASIAILMPLTHAELDITSGAINIAGGLKETELTGGLVNRDLAKDGDRVLYYFNNSAKRLVIEEKLSEIKNVKVTRLTATSANIGGKSYTLGVPGTAFTAESVAALLSVGESYDIVVRGNAVIDASAASTSESYASTYLIATSGVTPVVHKDRVCYFMTANIGGKSVNIYVTNSSVENGDVYRYEADEDGILTLVDAHNDKFAQSGEIKTVISNASSATIAKGENVYYTLASGTIENKFITDKDTIIVVGTPAGIVYKNGAYASTFTVEDGSKIVAVMKDSAGSVETLKYLYISSGSLGSAVDNSSFVQILENTATEQVGGTAMTVYTVYNFANGKVEQKYSENASLSVGTSYLLNENGHITSSVKSLSSGEVTGYAGNTITIGTSTYNLAEGIIISEIEVNSNGEFGAKKLSVSDIYGKNVSFTLDGSSVTRIIVNN
ncbi:MAG: S-layer homology domain-containing protein [Ruminococcaceae bacterium]|nr:S-layer homology domain-containing protein [Oscillospiraceae bacterium]